jgi:hypothetical protein
MFRQYLFISSLHILNKMSSNLPFSSKCIREVDSIFRMTRFVQIYWHCGCALTIQWRIQEFCLGPSHLFPPSFLPLPFSSLPIPFLCIMLIPSSLSLSHTTPSSPPVSLIPSFPLPFLPSPSTGVRGYDPRKIFQISDARR